MSRRFGWNSRWVEPREVAERLRIAVMLWILGVRPRALAGEEPVWTGWYVRALVRAQPLRSCNFDRATFDRARAGIINILEDQSKYLAVNARRMNSLERRLEWTWMSLCGATVLIAIDHLLFHEAFLRLLIDPLPANRVAIALSAILPALATATYGIRVIGDFAGIAKRSERAFHSLANQIEVLRHDPHDLEVLRQRARAAGEVMIGDIPNWRLSPKSRGLAIPG
jgi:hypothetical protein